MNTPHTVTPNFVELTSEPECIHIAPEVGGMWQPVTGCRRKSNLHEPISHLSLGECLEVIQQYKALGDLSREAGNAARAGSCIEPMYLSDPVGILVLCSKSGRYTCLHIQGSQVTFSHTYLEACMAELPPETITEPNMIIHGRRYDSLPFLDMPGPTDVIRMGSSHLIISPARLLESPDIPESLRKVAHAGRISALQAIVETGIRAYIPAVILECIAELRTSPEGYQLKRPECPWGPTARILLDYGED